MVDDDADLPTAPPDPAVLERMPDHAWAELLPHLRGALQDVVDEALTPPLRRLRAAPTKRLREGRVRRDLERALVDGGALWVAFRKRLAQDHLTRRHWRTALSAEATPLDRPEVSREVARSPDRDLVDRLKERARTLKQERDELSRQVEGANARAIAAEHSRDEALRATERLQADLEQLGDDLAAAQDGERTAADRANRRRDREMADLREQLRVARRDLDEARKEISAAKEALARALAEREPEAAPAEPMAVTRVMSGRPSQLPPQIAPGTTEYAKALLPRGRIVVVDGYNVTRTHRGHLSLADQREWLVGLLSGASARLGIEVTVVFDGSGGGGVGSQRTRGIRVEFSRGDLSADDDICLFVATIDPEMPVTVVTDDQELRERLAPDRVDFLFTREFLWAAD